MVIPGVPPLPLDFQASLTVEPGWLEIHTVLHNRGGGDLGVFGHPTPFVEARGLVLLVRQAALPVLPTKEMPGAPPPPCTRLAAGQQQRETLRIPRPVRPSAVPGRRAGRGGPVLFVMVAVGVFALDEALQLHPPDPHHRAVETALPLITALMRQRLVHRTFELQHPVLVLPPGSASG
jgi:hypothetical protein